MLNLNILNKNSDTSVPIIKFEKKNYSSQELAMLLYMLSNGIYAIELWNKLQSQLDVKKLQEVADIFDNIVMNATEKFNLMEMMENTDKLLVEQAKIPIVNNEGIITEDQE